MSEKLILLTEKLDGVSPMTQKGELGGTTSLIFVITMDTKLINAIQGELKEVPTFRTGMEVEVHQIIKEGNKERIQKFRGLVIKTSGKTGIEKTITVRKEADAGVAIEKIFPVQSPLVAKIDVIRQFKVRRANIGFIRKLTGKSARLKEVKKAA
jgi:large subunit ribosomal protein L19